MNIPKRFATIAFLLLVSGIFFPAFAQGTRYFIYAPTESADFPGSTQDATYKDKKAEEVLSFSFSVENPTDIASLSSGGGAGRARFERVELQFVGDLGIMPNLIGKTTTGDHYNDLVIEGVRSQGGGGPAENQFHFKLEMKLCLIESVELVGTQGDEAIYSVNIQFGAMKMTTKTLKADGSFDKVKEVQWSVVKNEPSFSVE